MEDYKSLHASVTLKGPNYLLWARTMQTLLCSKGYWNHITQSKPSQPLSIEDGGKGKGKDAGKDGVQSSEDQSKGAEDQDKWFRDDQTVMVILQNSLDAPILGGYFYCETAKELWDSLKRVYGNTSNLTRVFEIKKSISNLLQEDMSFPEHFGKWRALWAEMEMLRPCTYDATTINERREQDRVFGLLLTLHSGYNELIKHILRNDKLPSLDEVCAQIQKEYGSQGLFGGRGNMGLLTANKSYYKQEDRRNQFCEHCRKKGHIKDKCWILHPHLRPSWFRESKANAAHEGTEAQEVTKQVTRPSKIKPPETGIAATSSLQGETLKPDLEALIQTLKSLRDSGISLYSHKLHRPVIVDSGASDHMISDQNLIKDIKPARGNVVIANGERVPVKGIGVLELFNKATKAFHMPDFASNLLSVYKATNDLDCNVIFSPNDVKFQDIETGRIFGAGIAKDGLYMLEDSKLISNFPFAFKSDAGSSNKSLWHDRLGHPHSRALEIMFPDVVFENKDCEACILGKHCKSVFPTSSNIYENCFDLVHSDVWTAPCASRDNHKYFVTFIDEKSKYTWITLMPSKDRVFDAFKNFEAYISNQFNLKLKVLRSDNGGEYMSNVFQDYLTKKGILHQTSCPYTPQQNGVAERKNRHLMEVARSIMFHRNMPKRFWGDAVITACYLINRTPTKILKDASPFQVLNKLKPNLDHLRVFGCVCYVLVPGELRDKLDAKSRKCVFIGYSTTQKGYKCFDPETRRVYVSRDVKFFEDRSFFGDKDWEQLKDLSPESSGRSKILQVIIDHLEGQNTLKDSNVPNSTPRLDQEEVELSNQNQEPPIPEAAEPREPDTSDHDFNSAQSHPSYGDDLPSSTTSSNVGEQEVQESEAIDNNSDPTTHAPASQVPAQPLRRSTRVRKDPSNWKNTRVYYNNQAVAHPIQQVYSADLLPEEHQAFLLKIEAESIPRTYEEAKDRKVWQDAVGDEAQAMERNHTWDAADLPMGKKAVTSKWVFTIKYKSNGEIERYKARLVARGYTQTYGVDYTDTFAPVAKLHTVRVVLSLATNLDWELWQMDVKNAFLQGELQEEVYMTPPPGLEHTIPPGKVLRLRKAIYGLKQSPRAWYHKLSSTLKARGFRKSEADHTLFTLNTTKGKVVVLIYVDDLIISGDDKIGIQETKSFLQSVFDIKDLGALKYFLGIEVCRSHDGLFLSQRKYTLDLLAETGKLGAKAAKTPLEEGYKVSRKGESNDEEPLQDIQQYRRLVGKLIYLTITRPDLCFAVNQVSQHMQTPTKHHWTMIERILRYLKGSPGQGIWMGKNSNTEIVGYCDADWAGDRNDRKSTTGYCTFIGGNLVTWKTKKQKVVACSTAEAEYRAMRRLTDELVWLKALLQDLGIETTRPITMHCDNQAAIHIASNSVFHERTKHIEVDCHKTRERIEDGVVLPCYTRSEDQLADIFTKAASSKVCEFIHSKLGLINISRQ